MMSIKVSNAKLVKFSYHPLNAGNISQAKMKRVVDHKMSQHWWTVSCITKSNSWKRLNVHI